MTTATDTPTLPEGYRWASVSSRSWPASGSTRHAVRRGSDTSMCATTALPLGLWRANSVKPLCRDCVAALRRRGAKIADPYSPDLSRMFGRLHRTEVSGNAGAWWSCSCGAGSRTMARTQGVASAARDRHLRAEHKRFIAELQNGATHVVEYHDASWGGWRRADAFEDRPEAEFPIRALAKALAVDLLDYVRQVRIRSTWAGGVETITQVHR